MLPHKNRIEKQDFPSYQRQGFRVFSPFFTAVFYKTINKESRASVVVSKKTAKTAVVRNKIRRRFYSVLEPLFKNPSIKSTTIVVYPKIDARNAQFLVLKSEIEKAFIQAGLIK